MGSAEVVRTADADDCTDRDNVGDPVVVDDKDAEEDKLGVADRHMLAEAEKESRAVDMEVWVGVRVAVDETHTDIDCEVVPHGEGDREKSDTDAAADPLRVAEAQPVLEAPPDTVPESVCVRDLLDMPLEDRLALTLPLRDDDTELDAEL